MVKTVQVADPIHSEAKSRAAKKEIKLQRYVEDAITEKMNREEEL